MPQQGEQQRLSAWAGFAPKLAQWLKVIEGRGPAVVQQAYLDTLNGRVPPEQGHYPVAIERFRATAAAEAPANRRHLVTVFLRDPEWV